MAEISHVDKSKKPVMYTFRFGASDEHVHLTETELNCIPYLKKFVEHKNDFSSHQNENGEFVLNDFIEFTCFMAILRSVISRQPYRLFSELSENYNICDALQLFDYLNIDPFPLPILKDRSLVLTNAIKVHNDEKIIKFHKATLLEAQQTAAEFIIALHKNEYDLNDFNTVNEIFRLIKIIVSNRAVFSPRFRHHTIIVAQRCCYAFFSKTKRRQLPTIQALAKAHKKDSLMYNYSKYSSYLPGDFCNTFAWRGAYVQKEDSHTNALSTSSKQEDLLGIFNLRRETIHNDSDLFNVSFVDNSEQTTMVDWVSFKLFYRNLTTILESYILNIQVTSKDGKIHNFEDVLEKKENEAKAARSGLFNTLPKRPKVDKCKHRFGPKTKTYR
ncbi:unnamed protein product [Rotaria sp. Silwood1]|nr:unnamed protein product [Rotaria sp. Silwood1]CAF1567625.1 unnamed protein product [Rotaria sp. Silwood1]CAF3563471.1 unnamed protein product [Rotaria sp. Silwood1]CAF3608157.1 unnamed protein product [Rotaria sp. Silwood1]CAF3616478.1 unnamed protein product [Rotaria sp. Silwood1]